MSDTAGVLRPDRIRGLILCGTYQGCQSNRYRLIVSPANEPDVLVLLMHSPSVDPSTWQGVADRLRDIGVDVRVPSFVGVGDTDAPYWPQVSERAVDSIGVTTGMPVSFLT